MADENNIDINIGVNPAKAESGSVKAKTAISSVSREAKELDKAFRQIKSAIDPTFAAQERYNKSLSDAKRLLDAGRLSQDEYAAATRAAETALKAQVDAINRNSAANRAAAAEAKRLKSEELAATRAAAQAAVQAAREENAAKRAAATQARAESKARENEEKQAIRAAAAEARAATQAKVAQERQANAQLRAEASAARAAEKTQIREAAAAARAAATEKANAEKAASREAAAAERIAKQEVAAAAREAAQVAAQAAREKKAAEVQASREAAEAEKQAKREARQAARDAATEAARAAKVKRDAERESARATREAAAETRKLARAEQEAANAVRELRGSIDPAYAAQERYNQVMQRATNLLMQNKLQQGEWIQIQKQAKAQMDVNVRSMGRMNSVYVQMGYQAQDVTASIASGINPLVILAQQGGQTAAALSMMGGTVGRVASFFAGPWGAAIIGATLLLGLFIGKNKEAEKATIDVMDAESRRTAKIKELTEALKEYTKQQKEANTSTGESHRLSLQAQLDLQAEIDMKRAGLEAKLKEYTDRRDLNLQLGIDVDAYTLIRISQLQKALKELADQSREADAALKEAQITRAKDRAEQAVDPSKAITAKFDAQAEVAQNKFRIGTYTQIQLDKELLRIAQARKAAEDALAASKKKTKETTEETAKFIMPTAGKITSPFGKRESFRTANGNMASTNHAAIDIGAPKGAAVNAPQVGVVEAVGYSPTLGKYIVINHGAGVKTKFGHMDATMVEKGDRVTQGQQIGKVGQTGNATGPHLHYQVLVNGKPVDPTKGIFPIDQLEAEQKVAENAFQEMIAEYDRQIAAAEDNYQEALRIQDLKIAATEAYYGDESKEATDAARERLAIERKLNAQLLDEKRKGIQAQANADLAAEAIKSNGTEIGTEMKGDVSDFKANIGVITEKQAALEKQALLDEEYQNQVAHEQRMYQIKLQAVKDQLALADLPVAQRIQLNAQIETMEAEHNARMTVMQQQHARDAAQAQMAVASVTAQRWREVAGTLTSSMQQAFQGMWTHAQGWKQSLINIADQLVYKFVDMGAQMLQNWIMQQVTKKAVTAATTAAEVGVVTAGEVAKVGAVAAGTATQVATVATGAAAEKGITLGSALLSIGASAAKAAAGAYAALAGIPIIGPVIAPAAAALALGAVIAFGASIASARGGQAKVPKDGQITELHKDEMVLPAWAANPLREGLQTRGSSRGMFSGAAAAGASTRESTTNNTSGATFKYSPTHNYSDMSMERMLEKDGQVFRKWIRNQLRNGNLSFR